MTRPLTLSQRRRLAAAERKLAQAQARYATAPRGLRMIRLARMQVANFAALCAAVGRRV